MSNKEELNKQIAAKIEEAKKLLKEARDIAEENKMPYYVDDNDYSSLLDRDEWWSIGSNTGWMPSSAEC